MGHCCTKNICTNARFEKKLNVMMIHAIHSPQVNEFYEIFHSSFVVCFNQVYSEMLKVCSLKVQSLSRCSSILLLVFEVINSNMPSLKKRSKQSSSEVAFLPAPFKHDISSVITFWKKIVLSLLDSFFVVTQNQHNKLKTRVESYVQCNGFDLYKKL